jgi:hypothetical protein
MAPGRALWEAENESERKGDSPVHDRPRNFQTRRPVSLRLVRVSARSRLTAIWLAGPFSLRQQGMRPASLSALAYEFWSR